MAGCLCTVPAWLGVCVHVCLHKGMDGWVTVCTCACTGAWLPEGGVWWVPAGNVGAQIQTLLLMMLSKHSLKTCLYICVCVCMYMHSVCISI